LADNHLPILSGSSSLYCVHSPEIPILVVALRLPALSNVMRLLRKGGRFATGRTRLYFWASLGLLVLALAVVGGSRSFSQPIAGFLTVAAVLIFFKASLRRWLRWSLGTKGESAVTEVLKNLPHEYVVLNDIVLPGSKGNVDHVLIGPNGIFVIETKNYSGFVKCEDDQWFVNGRSVRSLSKQAKRNSMAVRGSIASLFKGPQAKKIPYVVPLLVFAGSRMRLKLFKPTVAVLRTSELVGFILDRDTSRVITADEKATMVNHLELLQRNFAETSDWPAETDVEEDRRKAG
jgi:hypothetical protein